MKKYKTYYAGDPSGHETIIASAPKAAALIFFSQNPYRNTVIVNTGWFNDQYFTCEELIEDIDGVNIGDIPIRKIDKFYPSTMELLFKAKSKW